MAQAVAPLMFAASAVTAAGQLSAGDAQAKGYSYNASIERQQAGENLDQSYLKAAQIERQNARNTGAQRAAYGASGVTPQGTPLAVMLDTATQGELNRRLALYQGRVDALGHMQQSDADIMSGRAARLASYYSAAGTLLTGGGRAASMPSSMGGFGGSSGSAAGMFA